MSRLFDVCGPLPTGTVVLEASAGTGKTTTIASLAARYVAEGVARLPELMLVTFGRAATAELRDRVRGRLVEVERALRDPAAAASGDEVVRHLATTGSAELALRRSRLARALSEVDAATITTTHGFCQQMLAVLGTVGDVDHDATLLPDVADLEAEVVDDLYLRKYAGAESAVLDVATARTVARAAVSDHAATLQPDDAAAGSAAQHRYGLARAVRDELGRRKRARRVVDYDDLLVLLRDALAHPVTGPAAVERVRGRYRVVMVDEFQDTDPVQWDILRLAFHGSRTLVLIGDPKQAIYAFRGADVATYLRAAQTGDAQTLGRNWRTDGPVIDGLAPILRGAALGDPRIVVHPVTAARTGRRLDGGPPVVLRQVTRDAVGATPGKQPAVGKVRELVYRDVAAQVVRTLEQTRLTDAPGGTTRPVRPADVAVLVRTNAEALAVHGAIVGAGVPAVISGLASVFGSASATDWLTLLTALTRLADSRTVAAAALTPFVGWDATRLALASDDDLDALADLVRGWAHVLDEHGVAALLEATAAAGLRERLLRGPDGERRLTDLRHVAEALHEAALDGGLGASALTEWLRARIDEAAVDYAEERSRRLETDSAAVQVITVHASKGLQFPVVLVPFAWNRWSPRSPEILRFHQDDERVLHVGGPGSPGYADALARHEADECGEDLRLAYVALTRAHSQVVLWWAPSANSSTSALSRLLLAPRDDHGTPAARVTVPNDAAASARFAALADSSGGTLVHEVVDRAPDTVRWRPSLPPAADLGVAVLGREVDLGWRRTSYSGLTAHAHHAGVGDEPENPGIQDEPDGDPTAAARDAAGTLGAAGTIDVDAALRGVPSTMADLPGGTAFGTLTHAVLEHVDTHAADLRAEVVQACRATGLATPLGVAPEVLADALLPALHTPLGPLAGGRTLADVAPADRLAELEFELPLAGGDEIAEPRAAAGAQSGREAASHATAHGREARADGRDGRGDVRAAGSLHDVADLLRRHLPSDDPFSGYADRLDGDLAGTRLRGYLTGSIDAVLRVPDGDGHRYLVVDYKTNRLAPHDEPLTTWHYRPDALVRAMTDSHYPLQLLLYSVALHRYLRWRLPGYSPDRHLGGGLYLFVRGMVGASTPVVDGVPTGVMSWRPPPPLVVALSDLLAHGPGEVAS
ncbi:UvrD-helicase domain-containing protein [Cellulomonas fimi]|uniref:UvrD-helicase domain-containing protein n=1 Tax=Cellulomonas fimi TaxID=1708 RepID=UPI00234DF953|nr:UvrD-helicase domain-containing protein [Cellulomonas fimi]MDC7120159.1 UvrD-helicase domain-containing protein [Cellulomonas fimi]